MNKNKIEKLKAIKEELALTQLRLDEARKLEESAQPEHLATLLENDLEQAELVLAAQDIMNKLQDMAEDLAKMNAQSLFPLVDKMKAAFGQEAARAFEESAQTAIQEAMNTVRRAKDELGTSIMRLEGKLPANDMAADTGSNMSAPAPQDDAMDASVDAALDSAMDDFGGADAASGPDAEPLGRARKESVEAAKAPLNEAVVLEAAGRKLLETETLESLIDWVLNEAAMGMPEDHFRSFAKSVATKAAADPVKLAGWIGKKKHGMAAMAQLAEPTFTQSADLDLVESIEEGKSFKKNDDDDSDKADRFKARNSARREKQKGDDTVEEGKTFKRSDDEDEDEDNWDKKNKFQSRNSARREKQKGDDTIDETALAARAVAQLIEASIAREGKGNAAKAVKEAVAYLAGKNLVEADTDVEALVLEAFSAEYGVKPAAYSVLKLREFQLSNQDKKVAAGVMGKVASKMTTDKSTATKSVSTALNGLSGQERSVAQKMINNMKADGQNPKNVGDFATMAADEIDGDKANESLDENINAAHWPTDSAGQYKGEPFQTDYGKLKAPKGGMAKTDDVAAPKAETAPKAEKPKAEGNPFAKKDEAEETVEDTSEETSEEK